MSSLDHLRFVFTARRAARPLRIVAKLRRLLLNLQSEFRSVFIQQSLAERVIDRNALAIDSDHHWHHVGIREIFSAVYIVIFRGA